jgi:hypothetical protein
LRRICHYGRWRHANADSHDDAGGSGQHQDWWLPARSMPKNGLPYKTQMSFLDSLEDNLKNMESREETGHGRGAAPNRHRDSERVKSQASAANAERLRKGAYTAELLKQATRLSHAMRTKVHLAWLGTTLRLEARGRKLELRPMPTGVIAAFLENNVEVRTAPVDLTGNPESLIREWLATLPPREEAPADLEKHSDLE